MNEGMGLILVGIVDLIGEEMVELGLHTLLLAKNLRLPDVVTVESLSSVNSSILPDPDRQILKSNSRPSL